eukprot:GHVT01067489.1.p1 GENE.GHVT01067489.1~~GHVT01067489.1.p1  ORF type:complete len:1107 (-),score=108.08 GHVT01067489.1:1768-5088(-)
MPYRPYSVITPWVTVWQIARSKWRGTKEAGVDTSADFLNVTLPLVGREGRDPIAALRRQHLEELFRIREELTNKQQEIDRLRSLTEAGVHIEGEESSPPNAKKRLITSPQTGSPLQRTLAQHGAQLRSGASNFGRVEYPSRTPSTKNMARPLVAASTAGTTGKGLSKKLIRSVSPTAADRGKLGQPRRPPTRQNTVTDTQVKVAQDPGKIVPVRSEWTSGQLNQIVSDIGMARRLLRSHIFQVDSYERNAGAGKRRRVWHRDIRMFRHQLGTASIEKRFQKRAERSGVTPQNAYSSSIQCVAGLALVEWLHRCGIPLRLRALHPADGDVRDRSSQGDRHKGIADLPIFPLASLRDTGDAQYTSVHSFGGREIAGAAITSDVAPAPGHATPSTHHTTFPPGSEVHHPDQRQDTHTNYYRAASAVRTVKALPRIKSAAEIRSYKRGSITEKYSRPESQGGKVNTGRRSGDTTKSEYLVLSAQTSQESTEVVKGAEENSMPQQYDAIQPPRDGQKKPAASALQYHKEKITLTGSTDETDPLVIKAENADAPVTVTALPSEKAADVSPVTSRYESSPCNVPIVGFSRPAITDLTEFSDSTTIFQQYRGSRSPLPASEQAQITDDNAFPNIPDRSNKKLKELVGEMKHAAICPSQNATVLAAVVAVTPAVATSPDTANPAVSHDMLADFVATAKAIGSGGPSAEIDAANSHMNALPPLDFAAHSEADVRLDFEVDGSIEWSGRGTASESFLSFPVSKALSSNGRHDREPSVQLPSSLRQPQRYEKYPAQRIIPPVVAERIHELPEAASLQRNAPYEDGLGIAANRSLMSRDIQSPSGSSSVPKKKGKFRQAKIDQSAYRRSRPVSQVAKGRGNLQELFRSPKLGRDPVISLHGQMSLNPPTDGLSADQPEGQSSFIEKSKTQSSRPQNPSDLEKQHNTGISMGNQVRALSPPLGKSPPKPKVQPRLTASKSAAVLGNRQKSPPLWNHSDLNVTPPISLRRSGDTSIEATGPQLVAAGQQRSVAVRRILRAPVLRSQGGTREGANTLPLGTSGDQHHIFGGQPGSSNQAAETASFRPFGDPVRPPTQVPPSQSIRRTLDLPRNRRPSGHLKR